MADYTNTQKDVSDFVNSIRKCLGETNTDAALTLITQNKHMPELQSSIAEIIPMISAQLNKDVLNEKPLLFSCSTTILDAIAKEFEAEEVLLQLIEDVAKAIDDTAFLTLLKPLQTVLLRLPKKRVNSLGWGLNAVSSYLKELPLPENLNLENHEEILMDADPLVGKISLLYFELVPFYDLLIESLQGDERKIILLKFVVQLLGRPLAFLDLELNEKNKSRARRVAESIVEKILMLTPDIFWLLQLQNDSDHDIGQIDELSLATLYYLVLVEEVFLERIPKVYDPIYVFQHTLHLATQLFTHDNQFVVRNGLQLSRVLLDLVQSTALSYELLDSDDHSKFCRALTNIIIYNPLQQYRQKGLKLFHQYLLQFESRGRYLLIYNLMKILNHTGIIGYTITVYKDMIMQEFDSASEGISIYFSDQKLFLLLNTFCTLPKGEESDLVELADQIVAALNLLRYLAIRDKANVTNIWHFFKALEKSYLEPLKKGLMLSRAHYELKIKELKTESGEGDMGDSKISLTVAGQKLTELPSNEKLQVLNYALTSFDVMEGLLGRLNELINMRVCGSSIELK